MSKLIKAELVTIYGDTGMIDLSKSIKSAKKLLYELK